MRDRVLGGGGINWDGLGQIAKRSAGCSGNWILLHSFEFLIAIRCRYTF